MAESTIITGQFVRISQVPASIGERILARFIDYVILICYVWSTIYVFSAIKLFDHSSDLTMGIIVIVFYLPVICYSLLWEMFNNGQSPGKKIVNIRVVKSDGTAPTFSGYLLRWLLYNIDVTFTGGLGVIIIIITKNNQRLGDLAAGTMVIKEKNYKKIQVNLDEFKYLTKDYRPVFPQAADLSLEQINVITRTLEMRTSERSKHIKQLADKIRQLLSIQSNSNDEAMLNTLIRDYQFYALEII
ncbi:RDD family protein [Bacteroides sp. 51]|uniref:RDD family protein n=1 Tax=Bacteroides sp. 51 TaxID=2302938 RepID=UPI0013D0EDA7|nr:RDD family protein [Bacteroides sp. 51]NDV83059.1 RDD family protein [Bacteroides sp. 51]